MANFLFIFRGGTASLVPPLPPSELQAHLAKWTTWMKGLREAGHKIQGQPLTRNGATVRGKERAVTDGPYAESKDLVTGTLVVDAPSLEAATELAKGCPIFELGGSVEVRAMVELG